MQTELPLKQTVTVKKPGSAARVKLEIAPGQKVIVGLPDALRPKLGLVSWMPQGDGSYKPVVKTRDSWVKLVDSLPAELGLDVDAKTLRRLVVAGIVEGRQPSPHVTEINLHSLDEHLEACRDPEYWIAVVKWPDGRKISRFAKYKEAM